MEHVSLAVFDYSNKKVCELYDSDALSAGQAYNIYKTEEIKQGWKELTFDLPLKVNGEKNFRWDFIKNDYYVRLREGAVSDWYLIKTPKRTKSGGVVTNSVKCVHISTNLKTKNLYMVFDDTNGIGTIQYLVGRALTNTGWTIGNCDTFYERDGVTEKIRSLSSKGKRGTYQQITDICDIFNAYPVYYGDVGSPKVDIRALENKYEIGELFVGKNLSSVSREASSDNMVTRLYVEGQYSDNGYVGIDTATDNTTKLPFLLNFDYYRNNGQVTQAQEAAITQYMSDYYQNNQALMAKITAILDGEDILNTAWGQPTYALYQLVNGVVDNTKTIYGGNILDADKTINPGDKLLVFKEGGQDPEDEDRYYYREEEADEQGHVNFANDDVCALKFVTQPSGKIGARQVAIESKEKMKANAQQKLADLFEIVRDPANRYGQVGQTVTFDVVANGPVQSYQWYYQVPGETTWRTVSAASGRTASYSLTIAERHNGYKYRCVLTNSDGLTATSYSAFLYIGSGENVNNPNRPESTKHKYYSDLITNYQDMIDKIYNGTEEATGLYEAMWAAVEVVIQLDEDKKDLAELQEEQAQIEADFASAMGELLKDGYWANTNYAPGQENELYYDALSYMSQVSKPKVKYGISLIMVPEQMGFTEGVPLLNSKVKIWDEEMSLNDIAYVSKRKVCFDDPQQGSIEISNEEIASAITRSFDDVFEQITNLADIVNQRNAIYERASVINANGTLPTENLVGTIDISEHTIQSPVSLWQTDEHGSLIFESPDGESAFRITGDGLEIAHELIGGEWNWESVFDGYGFDGSYISGGYISGDLIQTGTLNFTAFDDNFRTQIYQDERVIELTAQETNANGTVLRAAGLSVDANGVIVYADDVQNGIGSRFTTTANAISAEVTRATGAENTLSGRITTEAGKITQIVQAIGSNGEVTAASVVLAINAAGESIFAVNAGRIALNGQTVAASLDSQEISCADLTVSGDIETVNGDLTVNGNMSCDGSSSFYILSADEMSVNGADVSGAIATITKDQNPPYGTIGFNYTKLDGTSGNVNFNIADTQFFRDSVSAARSSVYAKKGTWANGAVAINPYYMNGSTETYAGGSGTVVNLIASVPTVSNAPHWINGNIVVTVKDGTEDTGLTHTVSIPTSSATWSAQQIGDTLYAVTCHVGGAAINKPGGLDTTGSYTAGQDDVTIIKGTWGNGSTNGTRKIDFTKSAGTQNTQSVVLSLNSVQMVSTDPNKWTVTAYDGNANTGASIIVDATSRYRSGSSSVTLANPDWGIAPSPLAANRTVSVSTSGRVDSNGMDANLKKDIALYLTQGSFDSAHKLTVSLRDTSSSGTVRAETEVDASGIYYAGWDDASAFTVPPSAGTGTTFVFLAPKTTTDQQGNKTRAQTTFNFILTKGATPDSIGYAAVEFGGRAVGQIPIGDWYDAGWGAAYGKVDLPDPLTELESNDTLTMDVKVPGQTVGTDATTTYTLSATQWNGNTAFAKLKAGNDDILRLTLDATPRYRAGSYAVTLANPDWGTALNPLPANRTVSVWTSGRVNSNGVSDELHKDISVTLQQGNWSNDHKMIVGLQSMGAIRAQTEVDASSVYNEGWGEARKSVGNFPESTPQTLTGSITFKKPSATVDGTADEYPYTLDVDNSYVYLKYGINPVARIPNPAFANGKTAHTATSAGTVTLTSSDTGSSVKNTTVTYSNSDTTANVPITIDASDVYGQGVSDGQDSVSAWIRANGSIVSGTLSLTSGQHITLYPSKKIGSSYTDITDYGVEVIAPTDSGSNVTLVSDDTSITATTATTDQIHFLGRRDNANSRTQIDVEVGVTLSNGRRYSRWITEINTGMTFAGRQNMYVYDSVDDTYVAIGVHDWFYKN